MSSAVNPGATSLRPAVTAFLAVAVLAVLAACGLTVSGVNADVAAIGLGALGLVLSVGGALLLAAGRRREAVNA